MNNTESFDVRRVTGVLQIFATYLHDSLFFVVDISFDLREMDKRHRKQGENLCII